MRLVTKLFSEPICLGDEEVFRLIIENQKIMRMFLKDLYQQSIGEEGIAILSNDDGYLKISKTVELITTFIPFELNEKRLLTKIQGLLEKEALNELNYQKTMELLGFIEKYVDNLAEIFPFILSYSDISPVSLIKMCGIKIQEDECSDIERVFQYMSLVQELLGDKLFIFVNMCSFFSKEEVQQFVHTTVSHKYCVLLIDDSEKFQLEGVQRLIVDEDLCII